MRSIFIGILLLLAGIISATTIYDIQYTTAAGDGTYPSLLSGQTVTTSGIVTATNYANGHGYVISMPEGGAWKGVLIYENSHSPAQGDLVQMTGLVTEYNGMTELTTITAYQVLSSGNTMPPAVQVATSEACSEIYEGVLVQVQNAHVTIGLNSYNEWTVSDGSGACVFNDIFIDTTALGYTIAPGLQFSYLRGVGFYSSYNSYTINPRSPLDLELGGQGVSISLPTLTQLVGTSFAIAINTSTLSLAQGFTSYHFTMTYNSNYISYQSYSQMATISGQGVVNVTNTPGVLNVNYSGNGILTGSGLLIILNFTAIQEGTTPITITQFQYNNTDITGIMPGQVDVYVIHPEVQEILTVIQRPLPTMPNIVLPGEIMTVECNAPTATTNWNLHLTRGTTDIPMSITDANYQLSPPRWVIHATVPNVPVYDLYNLKVTASGNINDMTKHSVQVLPSRKTDYYFVQVTDLHLPTHIFYPDAGYDTDSTAMNDFREVVRDINIIHPEFVLITGDIVNSGELEDYQSLYWFSKAKRILGELEVPVYIITGNHDVGGWTSTPPTAGTSRVDWFRFFGWSWLNNTSASYPYHTQDYSFDYGPVHFIGMDAYINYENYLQSIYGDQSFTQTQMMWLQNDLNVSQATTNVMFYHYDFSSQLDLTQLGVDMGLWGHIHTNSGSTTSQPYDLATKSCVDGNRAYRVIRVNGSTLQPQTTSGAGSNGSNIQISYSTNNDGNSSTVSATIANNLALSFQDTMVKFKMPHGSDNYTVQNGTLEQVDRTGDKNIAYVRVNLLSSSSITVTISTGTPNDDQGQTAVPAIQLTTSPNPFSDSTTMKLVSGNNEKATLKIYNLKGELIRTLYNGTLQSGVTNLTWDGKSDIGKDTSSGVFFYKLVTPRNSITRKLVRIH